MLKKSHKVAIHNLESTLSKKFNGYKKIFFLVWVHFWGNIDYKLWIAIKSKHSVYFSSMSNIY